MVRADGRDVPEGDAPEQRDRDRARVPLRDGDAEGPPVAREVAVHQRPEPRGGRDDGRRQPVERAALLVERLDVRGLLLRAPRLGRPRERPRARGREPRVAADALQNI